MKVFANTAKRFTDEHSGIEFFLLTPDAVESIPLSYDWPAFSPDNEWVIIRCQFPRESGKPSGFYRIRTDGTEIAHLSEGGIHPRLTPDGRTLFVLHPDSPVLHAIDLASGRDDEVCSLEKLLRRLGIRADAAVSRLRSPVCDVAAAGHHASAR